MDGVIKDAIFASDDLCVREMDLIVVINGGDVFSVCHDYPFGVYMSVLMILQRQFGQYDKPSSSNVLMSKSSYRSDRLTLQLLQLLLHRNSRHLKVCSVSLMNVGVPVMLARVIAGGNIS